MSCVLVEACTSDDMSHHERNACKNSRPVSEAFSHTFGSLASTSVRDPNMNATTACLLLQLILVLARISASGSYVIAVGEWMCSIFAM